ncbi:hypothetical protein NtB2_00194 [Lactococcus termiticola]|uniref:Bacterial Pleckstrin homology domain-containing protein n=1 Tax=Lactococcus termiticola TaxID=2169526 RepID=A0A2R5HIF1_9LACT|nr:hypothetical protein NtB2_00194 [Lactococcus termiticola]
MRSPGKWAGFFAKDGESFWYNVTRGEKPVVIQLRAEKQDRLILGVEEPEKLVDEINNL